MSTSKSVQGEKRRTAIAIMLFVLIFGTSYFAVKLYKLNKVVDKQSEVLEVAAESTLPPTQSPEEFSNLYGLYISLDSYDTRDVSCMKCTYDEVVVAYQGDVYKMTFAELVDRLTKKENE
jgi:hypothetical protein